MIVLAIKAAASPMTWLRRSCSFSADTPRITGTMG